MCQRGQALAVGEHYHVFNRGAHKQALFTCDEDHRRFLLLLLLANTSSPLNVRGTLQKYKGRISNEVFNEGSDKSLVDVLAYTLIPNHFHLILRQKVEGGIPSFMRKVCTSYSMYYNAKYRHGGVLFQGRYQSRHINNDDYFRYILAYIHSSPLDALCPHWKKAETRKNSEMKLLLSNYPYSSYIDYCAHQRSERNILSDCGLPKFLDIQADLENFLEWQV